MNKRLISIVSGFLVWLCLGISTGVYVGRREHDVFAGVLAFLLVGVLFDIRTDVRELRERR